MDNKEENKIEKIWFQTSEMNNEESEIGKMFWLQYSKICCKFCSVRFTLSKLQEFNEKCKICNMWFFNQYFLEKHRTIHWCYNFNVNEKCFFV